MKVLYIDQRTDTAGPLGSFLTDSKHELHFVRADSTATNILQQELEKEKPNVVLIGGYDGYFQELVGVAKALVGGNWAIISGTDFSGEVGEGHYTRHFGREVVELIERMQGSVRGESEG